MPLHLLHALTRRFVKAHREKSVKFRIPPSRMPDSMCISSMRTFFEFNGRGTHRIGYDQIFKLEPDSGAVFLISTKIGNVEFVVAWCRAAIIERWGCYSIGAFRRISSPDLKRSWAEPLACELMIYRAVMVYLVPEEPWMTAPPGRNAAAP